MPTIETRQAPTTPSPDTETPETETAEHANLPDYSEPLHRVLPPRSVHLIAGASEVGKSYLARQLQHALTHPGTPFLSLPALKAPYRASQVAYLTQGRSVSHYQFIARRMELLDLPKPIPLPFDLRQPNSDRLAHALTLARSARVLIIEELMSLAPAASFRNDQIDEFLDRLWETAERLDLTIIGTIGSPKKAADYADPRDRVLGSTSIQRRTATILLVERVSFEDPADPGRYVWTLCQDPAHRRRLHVKFSESNRFILAPDQGCPVENFVAALSPDDVFHTSDVYKASTDISQSAVRARLAGLVTNGTIRRLEGKGYYHVPPIQ